jgi:hypothetical protein
MRAVDVRVRAVLFQQRLELGAGELGVQHFARARVHDA